MRECRRLLTCLRIKYSTNDTLRSLRSKLKGCLTGLKKSKDAVAKRKVRETEVRRERVLEARTSALQETHSNWPQIPTTTVVEQAVENFMVMTGSQSNMQCVCAICAKLTLASRCLLEPLSSFDRSLLERDVESPVPDAFLGHSLLSGLALDA